MASRFTVTAACCFQRVIRLVPQSCTTKSILQSRNFSATCGLSKKAPSALTQADGEMFRPGFTNLPALEGASQDVQKMLKLNFAPKQEWNKERINQIKQQFKQHPEDDGSAPVQIGALSVRIEYLKDHMRIHRKDKNTLRALMKLIHQRRKLLVHMRYTDFTYYHELLSQLQIKPIAEYKFKKNKHPKP